MKPIRVAVLAVLVLLVAAGCARKKGVAADGLPRPEDLSSVFFTAADTARWHDTEVEHRLIEKKFRRELQAYVNRGACRSHTVDVDRTVVTVEIGPGWTKLGPHDRDYLAHILRWLTDLRELGEVRFVDHGRVVARQLEDDAPIE
jgi:hypothetical protein